ncbi:iron complex outermembrane receptor protein [Sulfuritortus calidifontis]|uniref:Iron complex outermembrane receptor protein n=2 Tax=Sulfuritortus calidifontis TaxID=1914471 RepID=A0A4R3K0Z3_9PROT|nr:iron complex outermembrane receptor protein [Sulfuritortus calidifontis]
MLCQLAVLAPMLMAQSVWAEVSEDLFLMELPTVLTAARIAQSPLDAPAPVTVIDRDMIRTSGASEIHDLFRLAPGFLVADWPDGSPIVVNRGLGDGYSRRLLVLLDGHSVFDPFRGGVDWQDLPLRLDDIERIEVVRGPNQASYGANALQGVINIITRLPVQDAGIAAYAAYGRQGHYDAYARAGGGDGESAWRFSASSRAATNFQDLGRQNYDWQEGIQRQTFYGQWHYRPRAADEWRLQLGFSQGTDEVGSNKLTNIEPHHDRDNRNLFLQLGWRRAYDQGSEIAWQYYHYSRAERERYLVYPTDPAAVVPFIPVNLDVDMRRDDLELQQAHVWNDRLKGVWGLGVRRDAVESAHYLHGLGEVSGTQWQVFGNIDWQFLPRWLLHLGGMVEKHYLTDTLFSPRLALNYALTPLHSLRLSVGRGYRAPNLFEMKSREVYTYGGGIAEVGYWSYQSLLPEAVAFREVAYIGRFPELRAQAGLRLFMEDHSNYIDAKTCTLDTAACPFTAPAGYARPFGYPGKFLIGDKFGNPKAYYFYNAGDVRVRGGDASLDWRHPQFGRFVLSHAVTTISTQGEVDVDWRDSAPMQSTSLLWSRGFSRGLQVSVAAYWLGDMMWPSDGDVQPGYRRIDLKLAKRLGKAGSEDEIALTLQNLGDKHMEFSDYTAERQAFVSLRLGW